MERNVIILLRHGETNFASQGIIQGHSDDAILTDTGIHQIENASRMLASMKIDELYSSPLKRAVETTDIVRRCINITSDAVKYDNRLSEIDFVGWTGMSKEDVLKNDSQRFGLWRTSPIELEFDGYFPVKNLYSCIHMFCEPLLDPFSSRSTILISAHKGSILSIIVTLLGLSSSEHNFLHIDHGSLTILRESPRDDKQICYEIIAANLKGSEIVLDSLADV